MRHHGTSALLAVALAVTLVPAVARSQDDPVRRAQRRVMPDELPMSTPEEQGMDSYRLAEAVDFLTAHRLDYRPHQVIVVRHGRRVLDVALYPFEQGLRHDIASVGKMVTGTLIGIAVDKGFIAGADTPVLSFFPERQIANRDPRKEAMTIAHLLAQRSGIYHGDDGSHSAEDAEMYASADWVQWVLDRPMAEAPGGTWYYSNANLHLAAGALSQATGMSPLAFARRYLFPPLHIADVAWEADPQGVNNGAGGQEYRPLDLAKIGQLYLDGGAWRGQQVLSSGWVARSTSPAPGPHPAGWPPDSSVGFHWVIEDNYRGAGGSGGQNVELYPDDDIVIVVVAGGGTPYAGCSNPVALSAPLYSQFIRPAIVSDSALPPNPAGVAALAASVAAAAVSYEGPPKPVPTLPATALAISGKRFALEPNPLHISSFSLSFSGGSEATLQVAGEEEVTFRVGLDDVFRYAPGEGGLPAAAKGSWSASTRFVAIVDQFAIFAYLRVTMDFAGSRVTVTIDDLACPGGGSVTLTGTMQS
jgi:CubicO group peptidase (beta-lactamase class C family)